MLFVITHLIVNLFDRWRLPKCQLPHTRRFTAMLEYICIELEWLGIFLDQFVLFTKYLIKVSIIIWWKETQECAKCYIKSWFDCVCMLSYVHKTNSIRFGRWEELHLCPFHSRPNDNYLRQEYQNNVYTHRNYKKQRRHSAKTINQLHTCNCTWIIFARFS